LLTWHGWGIRGGVVVKGARVANLTAFACGDMARVWVGMKWRRGRVICVRLVVVEWVGGADVAPKRAVDGGQVVGIIVRQLGLTYPGVTTVTWHREGGTSARKRC